MLHVQEAVSEANRGGRFEASFLLARLAPPPGCCTTLAYDTPGRFWTNIKRDTVLMRLDPDDPGTLSCFSGNCLCCTCKRL